ncbi:FR47-like protein [Actinacidiphila guanduensis]|uniref:FR47-like protein n=1 Tax=Actinacidiphila guanduensis TaxID=310781 RepID=A0A1G9WI48_9ACTN|nr:FR47-like protein [Actinacidiphila guanduensis]
MTPSSPETCGPDPSVLVNVVHAALRTRHAHLAEAEGRALRYTAAVAPFAAVPDEPSGRDWDDLAVLAHRTGGLALHREPGALPAGWDAAHGIDVHRMTVLQFSGAGLRASAADADDPDVRALTPSDVPAMRDLADRTRPGPFGERTIELGGYVGIMRDGVLAAMAGRRFSAPTGGQQGWTEISAVCTDPAFRGQGLATRLIRTLAAGIRAHGDEVFLHVVDTNTAATALYKRLGFEPLSTVEVTRLTPRR